MEFVNNLNTGKCLKLIFKLQYSNENALMFSIGLPESV